MKEIVTFEDCRNKLNNISTTSQLEEILKVFTRIIEGEHYYYATIGDWTIGWSDNLCSIYILENKELVEYTRIENGKINNITINFILDNILKLNTDAFYKFYFKKYGYESLVDHCKSNIVKNILNQFITSKATMRNIFISEEYNSITISGNKKNGTDYECNTLGCTKEDIKELIQLVRITPHINKKSIFSDYDKPYKPYFGTPDSTIKNAYNEYKNYCDCEEERIRNINIEDDYIKDDETDDYWEDE